MGSGNKIHIPRNKRFNDRDFDFGYVKVVTASKRLEEIHNSPGVDKNLLDTYLSALEHENELFGQYFDEYPDIQEYPKAFRNVLQDERTVSMANHHPEVTVANHVVVNVRGSPFLAFSELFLRSTIVTNVRNALGLLDEGGGLIIELNYVTIASRLMLQIFSILFSCFQSTEFLYMERGTVLLWFR